MRDELDARLWVDHHEAFAEAVGRAAAKAGRALRFRLPRTLLAAAAALAFSSATVLSAIGPVEAAPVAQAPQA